MNEFNPVEEILNRLRKLAHQFQQSAMRSQSNRGQSGVAAEPGTFEVKLGKWMGVEAAIEAINNMESQLSFANSKEGNR